MSCCLCWQADYALATLDALPPIAATVAGRVPILVDGGVRRGTDIMKVRPHGGCQPSFPSHPLGDELVLTRLN